MKSNIKIQLRLVGYVFLFSIFGMSATESVSTTATFSLSSMNVTVDTINGVAYSKIDCSDIYSMGLAGTPSLPVKHYRFSVPYNATNFSVSISSTEVTEESVAHAVVPNQEPQPSAVNATDVPFTQPDNTIYSVDSYWPASLVSVADEGFLDGSNHIVTVAMSPVTYNNVLKKLRIYTSAVITLNYDIAGQTVSSNGGAASSVLLQPIYSTNILSTTGRDEVKQMVVNPTQVDGFAPSTTISPAQEVIDYVVVTNRQLAPSFDRLIGWKRQKGYHAKVICIEDILSDTRVKNGDVVSSINDDAGKLRQYLSILYQNNSLKYVLFGGDNTILPIRYGKAYYGSNPTDLYFSDFNGNWDRNGNHIYGEDLGDRIDVNPEIYVGRILCETPQDVNNYTEKLLRYEINPGNGDYSYLSKAFYTQSDQMLEKKQANSISKELESIFPQYTIYSEAPSYDSFEPTFPTGTEVINEMNNRYGFFSWYGHGSPEGITTMCKGNHEYGAHGIVALCHHRKDYIDEEGNGLDNMTNFDYPAIAYSIACHTTPYDVDDNFPSRYNIGYSYTTGGLYGGPAFLGNTRDGWILGSPNLETMFVKCLIDGIYKIGKTEAMSKVNYSDNYLRLVHNLIGCPEFEIWTGTPRKYSNISVQREVNSISVIGRYLFGSTVAIASIDGTVTSISPANTVQRFTNVSPNSSVVVYRHNYIPYIAPLYLQNGNVDTQCYLLASKVYMGNAVESSRTDGDFVIDEGADITIDASDDVVITSGFIVKPGAKITIKSKGIVKISGGDILANGKISIFAKSTEIQKGFSAQKGAVVEINNLK